MSEPFKQGSCKYNHSCSVAEKEKLLSPFNLHTALPPPLPPFFFFFYGKETPLKIKRDPKGWSHKAK